MAKSSNRDGRVKTWRALKDGLRVGDSVRDFGDFVPEAKTLGTLATLLRADVVEEVWVDQEELDEWAEQQEEKDAARVAMLNGDVVEEDDEDVVDDEDEDESDADVAPPTVKKPVKKAVAKKSVKKKTTVKKGKPNGTLAEQSV